ncbi:MAG: TetR/AcrR family transcriptional regulator [Acetobacteraceae bacterium]|nr:TetR/AcrR family transcriptional regulator [Acetobacteraceae bacterium]
MEATPIAAICRAAGVSNGSFFHAFANKEALAAALFMDALESYHGAMTDAVADRPGACEGVSGLVRAHLDWVVGERSKARFLFEQSRSEWMGHVRERQAAENAAFGERIDAWRLPLVRAGHLADLPSAIFLAQLIGPAQLVCRAWLAGRSREDPRGAADALAACARRALAPSPAAEAAWR